MQARIPIARWEKTGVKCRDETRLLGDEYLLCAFDEGFLYGYEFGIEQSEPTSGPAVRMILTPLPAKDKTQ